MMDCVYVRGKKGKNHNNCEHTKFRRGFFLLSIFLVLIA